MSKANDLTGRTFGLLKVLRRVEDVKPGRPLWLCECRCGRSVVKSSTNLTKQNGVKSCGCLRHQKSPELIDLTDMTFGALRVLYQDRSAQTDKARWICQCSCRNIVSVLSESLRHSKTTSCGCKCQTLKYDLTGREFGHLKVIGRAQGQSKIKRSILAMPLPKLRQDRPCQQLSSAPFQPIRTL